MSCTSFLKRLACIRTETATVDSAVNKQLNAAQQIASGLTPAHKLLIKKQVKKELAKANQCHLLWLMSSMNILKLDTRLSLLVTMR